MFRVKRSTISFELEQTLYTRVVGLGVLNDDGFKGFAMLVEIFSEESVDDVVVGDNCHFPIFLPVLQQHLLYFVDPFSQFLTRFIDNLRFDEIQKNLLLLLKSQILTLLLILSPVLLMMWG